MGLYDRDYMRDEEPAYRPSFSGQPWSPTIALLVLLVVLFFVHGIIANQAGISWNHFLFRLGFPGGRDPMTYDFGLSLAGLLAGKFWQLFTFQFLHGGIAHLAFNGLALFSFGRFLEKELGRGRFLTLYFLSGLAGGLLQMAATFLLRQNPNIPCVGASAGISGLLGAFILSYPEVRLFMIPIPFPIRAWTLLWILLPVSIVGAVFPNLPLLGGIAHAAHLGGLLAGGAFIRWTWLSANRRSRRANDSPPPILETRPPEPKDSFSSEVDAVLDKINAQGIHSLTDRERKILETARAKMQKR